MKKIISYRDKLLELAKIYNITEIRNYIRNKKYLTTIQLELILKKNKVPIPKEIHKNILEIHSKKIKKPFFVAGSLLTNLVNKTLKETLKLYLNTNNKIKSFFYLVYGFILNFFSSISKVTLKILNGAYNFKIEEKKANPVVTKVIYVTLLLTLVFGGIELKEFIYKDGKFLEMKVIKNQDIKTKEIIKKSEKKITKELIKKEIVKKPNKEINQKTVKAPSKQEKKKESAKEFVLPDLNLKTDTVLSLFDDVEYDLKKVRISKLVKPIYFTQFPKDLDEITSVKLKKETFIKIVLPLVVAENTKILDDRSKLKKISRKKMTSEKEKSWLRQKFKEYKVLKGSVVELEKRMDIIPVSIAIAQAAKESGWGTSRFALEGNAIFGQWTWSGRGLEPLDRSKEMSHKILRFPILRASVKAYKNNLNTHKSYKEFREKRFSLRKKNRSIKGIKLIHTLDNYAQTGVEYTKILAKMMEQNSLEDFENVKLTNSVVKKELNL